MRVGLREILLLVGLTFVACENSSVDPNFMPGIAAPGAELPTSKLTFDFSLLYYDESAGAVIATTCQDTDELMLAVYALVQNTSSETISEFSALFGSPLSKVPADTFLEVPLCTSEIAPGAQCAFVVVGQVPAERVDSWSTVSWKEEGHSRSRDISIALLHLADGDASSFSMNFGLSYLPLGSTQQVIGTRNNCDSSSSDVSASTSWSSSNPSAVSISSTGLVTALTAGTTTLTGSYGYYTATATVTGTSPCGLGQTCAYEFPEHAYGILHCTAGTITVNSAPYGIVGTTNNCFAYTNGLCGGQTTCGLVYTNGHCGGDPLVGTPKFGFVNITCN